MTRKHSDITRTSGAEGNTLRYTIVPGDETGIDRLIVIDKAAARLFVPTGLLSDEALADHVPAGSFRDAILSGWLFVAHLHTGEAIGFVLASRRGKDLYVEQISVDPAYGQRGAGRALMAYLEDRARSHGVRAMTLSTFRELSWNAPFYASLGYRELERSAFAPYMLEIEKAQVPHMDVTRRTFMRKQLRKRFIRARTRP